MKRLVLLFLVISTTLLAQDGDDHAFAKADSQDFLLIAEYSGKAKSYQEQLNATYANPDSTILSRKQLRKFKGLKFWPISQEFRVKAIFEPATNPVPIDMATSTGVPRVYNTYGTVTFQIDGEQLKLTLFQNPAFISKPNHPYKDHLLLGFTDYTSGDGSYGGGRYVDLLVTEIQEDNTVWIDFNKAYNPYCAYTSGYSCAIPPEENDLKVRVEAGVKDYKKEY